MSKKHRTEPPGQVTADAIAAEESLPSNWSPFEAGAAHLEVLLPALKRRSTLSTPPVLFL